MRTGRRDWIAPRTRPVHPPRAPAPRTRTAHPLRADRTAQTAPRQPYNTGASTRRSSSSSRAARAA
ncbi:MAG: hypothetical protein AMXMBFR52_25110 [Burkholderiales bacterium]